MPHERLNALLVSFIPLIPLFFQRGAQDIDWGQTVTNRKPFALKYLPPVPELLKDDALATLCNHECDIDSITGPRWFLDAISQHLGTSHPVADALGALRSHFQVNVIPSSRLLWVIGLLFLALLLFFDLEDVPASSPDSIITSYETSAQISPANTCPTYASASVESFKSDHYLDWRGALDDRIPLPTFGIKLSTHLQLTPIEEEEEGVQDQDASFPLSTDAVATNEMELVVRGSSSSHLSSPLSFQSSSHTAIRNLPSPDLSIPSTPSHSAEGGIGEQPYPSLGNDMDASSTSTDFVFTVVPPSTSDLDMHPDSPSSPPQGEAAEAFVPSTAGAAGLVQTAPSSQLPFAFFVHQPNEITPVEDQLEEVHGPETSLAVVDGLGEISSLLVSKPIAVPALDEQPQPTVQELDQLPSPARSRALSNITEITEPNDSSDSSPGTPRVEWFSGIHGRLASLDHHGLTLQATQSAAEGGTAASTPEVDVDSHWSLVGLPSGMEDFLPLSTSTPNLHSTVVCQPEDANGSLREDSGSLQVHGASCLGLLGGLNRSLHGVVDATNPELPSPLLVDLTGSVDGHTPLSPSTGSQLDIGNKVDEGGRSFEDATALPPVVSATNVISEIQSPPQVSVANTDEVAPEQPFSTVPSPVVAQISLDVSIPAHPCLLLASPQVSVASILPTLSSTIVDCGQLQNYPPAPPDRPTPKVTHARRASKVLVARTGIAGQQVALTDAGLAQLVARIDEPLLPEEDTRGERRRMERVTNAVMGEHSAERGEPRHSYQVIHERRYSNEPISARVERNIIDTALHPPLKNDPYIRVPVCELGRSRSSVHVRSTTNVALVKRPSVSTSSQDLSAVAASPLLLPRNWGHCRAQSETANGSGMPVAGDQNRRLSYAAIAAKEPPSQPLRLPVDSNEAPKPTTVHRVSSTKVTAVEPVKAKPRTVSAPASSTSPMFRFGHADNQASWRNRNRWSALAALTSEETFTFIGKGKGRLQELPSMAIPRTIMGEGGTVLEKRWPQSRLLKAKTPAPSAGVGKASEAMCSPLVTSGQHNSLGSSDAGASRMRGSMLSAASRVKLRDLALSAQRSVVASPAVSTPSPCLDSSSNFASGSGATPGSGVTSSSSGSSSASSQSVIIVCSGTTCVPVSFAQPGPTVSDKAPLVGQSQADFVETSGDLLAQSQATQPLSGDASQLVSLLLLPTRSLPDVHSSLLDESADLVIASRECRPVSPSGDCPAVVRLNASSITSALSSSPHFRSSTAPTRASSPSASGVGKSLSRIPVAVPSRHDFAPRGIAVPRMPTPDQVPDLDVAKPPNRKRGRRGIMSSTSLQREQRSTRATGFRVRGTPQGQGEGLSLAPVGTR